MGGRIEGKRVNSSIHKCLERMKITHENMTEADSLQNFPFIVPGEILFGNKLVPDIRNTSHTSPYLDKL